MDRGGILILRVWVEDDRSDGFRARIICTIGPEQARSWVVGAADEVHTLVQNWLDELLELDR